LDTASGFLIANARRKKKVAKIHANEPMFARQHYAMLSERKANKLMQLLSPDCVDAKWMQCSEPCGFPFCQPQKLRMVAAQVFYECGESEW